MALSDHVDLQSNLQLKLDRLREKYGVVGASLAVLHNAQIHAASSGLLNLDTRLNVTPDALFQIGSITKVFTAVLVMQLVDEGRLDLDRPVQAYLPSFQLADAKASSAITIRQLLCHTSGMEGDFFPDDDPFGPSIAGFVERCRLLPQIHPVGENFSYCNSGYTLAGRIIEVVTGQPWRQVLVEKILQPLGMQQSIVDPAEVLRFRAAMGHISDRLDSTALRVAPHCYLPQSHAPAGTVLSMSASDLLRFARLAMNAGRNGDGESVLSERSLAQMKEPQVSIPPHSPWGMTHWGLGWIVGKQDPYPVLGHYGGTFGQFSYLRIFEQQGLAIALLTNSESMALYNALEEELLSDLVGFESKPEPAPVKTAIDPLRFIGRYENIAQVATVFEHAGDLFLERRDKQAPSVSSSSTLQFIDDDSFALIKEPDSAPQNIHFQGAGKDKAALYLSIGFRLLRRVG